MVTHGRGDVRRRRRLTSPSLGRGNSRFGEDEAERFTHRKLRARARWLKASKLPPLVRLRPLTQYWTLSMSGPKKYSREDFLKVFPDLVEDIKQDATKYNVPQNALDWLENVCLHG